MYQSRNIFKKLVISLFDQGVKGALMDEKAVSEKLN